MCDRELSPSIELQILQRHELTGLIKGAGASLFVASLLGFDLLIVQLSEAMAHGVPIPFTRWGPGEVLGPRLEQVSGYLESCKCRILTCPKVSSTRC